MRKFFFAAILLAGTFAIPRALIAQTDSSIQYKLTTAMVPMRDGVRLFTSILAPAKASGTSPVLLERTPYGATVPPDFNPVNFPYLAAMAREGYIFVIQDIRGKYKSEGTMQIHLPLTHAEKKGSIDESTDTWDTVDWLVKNTPGNNGNVGIVGISYPGWLALVGSVDPHPALKAASEQACMGDLFKGDDFHHNGAFRLSYGLEYSYEVEHDKTTDSDFPFPQFDLFDWYRNLGSLKNVNAKYFHGTIPTWNSFVAHPAYDKYWQQNSPVNYVHEPQIPMLHVGGYFDQEDINGPQLMYAHMEKLDTFHRNYLVLGPWFHGQWSGGRADSLGKIAFHSNTAAYFQDIQREWFDYWLKGTGDGKFDEATCFQTGSNQWRSYSTWPPKEAVSMKLYAQANRKCSFAKPEIVSGSVSFVSDPANPVPYRPLPIEQTYGRGSRWRSWQVEDQRFAYSRPDVISFIMDSLTQDLTVTGKVVAHLVASTTATDADWIVKLIDVYPDFDSSNYLMSQYQFPVAMEVFRGRFHKSFSQPAPLVPNKPEEFVIDLHDINHTFLKGHKIMIQVQSTWFPVIDRNPQKYVANIFEANDADYIPATHRIYCNSRYATYVDLPVIR
ncbi:MAG TPA: CocE/NonD family hydrolase [Chitinophagaceae bacterium]